jgi:hypothetical protein
VSLQFLPLLKELELPKTENLQILRTAVEPMFEVSRAALPDAGFPLGPDCAAVRLFAGHEQCEIVQPPGMGRAESIELAAIFGRRVLQKVQGSLAQDTQFEADDGAIVNLIFAETGSNQVVVGQQTFPLQLQ